MVYTVNTQAADVLTQLSQSPRIKELGFQYSVGWNETTDRQKGYFDSHWSRPTSWNSTILQGPHIGVATPINKEPNPTMKNNQDWTPVDLEDISEDFIPATAYELTDRGVRESLIRTGMPEGTSTDVSPQGHYRIAYREMAATTGFRTLYPALIPPMAMHVHAVHSMWTKDLLELSVVGATMSSIISDFWVRSSGSAHIFNDIIEKLPALKVAGSEDLALKFLQLNCLTSEYAEIWENVLGTAWSKSSPVRRPEDRRALLDEIDLIVAKMFGLSEFELAEIYRTQFPVMRSRDRSSGHIPIYFSSQIKY